MKIFILLVRLSCNIVKYTFFHHTALIWNKLHNNVINATTGRLFDELILRTPICCLSYKAGLSICRFSARSASKCYSITFYCVSVIIITNIEISNMQVLLP